MIDHLVGLEGSCSHEPTMKSKTYQCSAFLKIVVSRLLKMRSSHENIFFLLAVSRNIVVYTFLSRLTQMPFSCDCCTVVVSVMII